MKSDTWPLACVAVLTMAGYLVWAEEENIGVSFTRERIIASGERGGPLTPTSTAFSTEGNRSFGEAMAAWNAHRYAQAVEKMHAHIATFPRSPWAAEAELHVGCFNYYAGRYDEAERSFRRVLDGHKNGQIRRKTLVRQGIMCAESGRYEEAGDCFKECLKLKPTWQQATLCRSWLMKAHRLKMMRNRPRDCGAQAVRRVLELKGLPLPDEGEVPEEASTFSEIAALAARHGLKTSGEKLTYDELASLEEPAIVHIEPSHFLVVERADARHVFAIDPQGGRSILKKARFMDLWDGRTLILDTGGEKYGAHTLTKKEMEETEGGCCGLAQLADEYGATDDNLPLSGQCPVRYGEPFVSINPALATR